MVASLNQVLIIGALGADPEVRRTQDGKPIVNLNMAVSEQWRDRDGNRKESTEWIRTVIFSEGLAKLAEAYLKKGSRVLLQGKWKTRKWTDQSGQDRYSTELVLQGFDAKLVMLDSAEKPKDRQQTSYDEPPESRGGSYASSMDDDIPFLMEWR